MSDFWLWVDPMFWTILATVGVGLVIGVLFWGAWRLIDWWYDKGDKDMRVYSVSLGKDTAPYTEKSAKDVCQGLLDNLEAAEIGEMVTITVGQMTEEEYAALPEWSGP